MCVMYSWYLHPLRTVCTTIAPRVLHFSAVHCNLSSGQWRKWLLRWPLPTHTHVHLLQCLLPMHKCTVAMVTAFYTHMCTICCLVAVVCHMARWYNISSTVRTVSCYSDTNWWSYSSYTAVSHGTDSPVRCDQSSAGVICHDGIRLSKCSIYIMGQVRLDTPGMICHKLSVV